MFEAYRKLALALGAPLLAAPRKSCGKDFVDRNHNTALAAAREETQVILDESRLRVGVTRGHLLEVVVQVPLDVAGDPESLQLAAEIYLETLLGDALLDEWVASVGIDRIARRSGLLLVADSRSSAPAHPLEDAGSLVRLGIDGIRGQLPESLFTLPVAQGDWTALEIPEIQAGLQAERRFASTRFPEALKCALEGMPFSSTRFTRGAEKFCWLSWRAPAEVGERLDTRARIEHALLSERCAPHLLVSGSGFGPRRDYLDLWTLLSWPELPGVLRELESWVSDLELGFYDSEFKDAPLLISRVQRT